MQHSRWVAIDVEPGGATTPKAYLGAVEVVDGRVGARVLIRIAAERRDEWTGRLQIPAGWHLDDALRMLDAFVADDPVVVYNARYDCAALRRMHASAGMVLPEWRCLDALRVVRAAERGERGNFYSLQSVVLRRHLFSDEECDRRRLIARTQRTNKWLLHDAEDDALAAALVVLDCADDPTDSLEEVAAKHGVSWTPLAGRSDTNAPGA
jgi:DNA polymerase III epsilon subunit-like protein